MSLFDRIIIIIRNFIIIVALLKVYRDEIETTPDQARQARSSHCFTFSFF